MYFGKLTHLMEVVEAKESSATKVWRQDNLGKLYPKSQEHIKEKKHLKSEENLEKSWIDYASRAQHHASCSLLLSERFFFHTASCAPCMKACTPHMLSVKNQATRPQHVSIYVPQACCVWIFFLFKAYLHLEIFIQQLRSS